MLKPEFTGRFKRDYKLAVKRGYDKALLEEVISILMREQPLPPKYKDHPLQDSKHYKGVRECHIQPDWLLIYQINRVGMTPKPAQTRVNTGFLTCHFAL